MGIASQESGDLSAQVARFQAWLRERGHEHERSTISSFKPGSGGGFSNETFFVKVERPAMPVEEYVIRFGPANPADALFPDYDIPKQFEVMRALAAHSDVPVPNCLWLERDAAVFGSPFFVMEKAEGEVPSDDPPFTTAGFVFEASPAEREQLWWSAVESIAKVGRVDVPSAGLSVLQPKDPTLSPILNELNFYEGIYRWGRGQSAEFPLMERAIEWLRAKAPPCASGFLWGDAKLANMMVRGFKVSTLLDWELATLGDPESDLAYFLGKQLLMENHYIRPELSRPRLEGFPSDEETIAHYGSALGRPVRHYEYYRTFNFFKTMAMIQRAMDLFVRAGWMSSEEAEMRKVSGGKMSEAIADVVGR
jgi:aminoglycoside phosphotransferase (APT) family kinase protein